MTLPLFDGSVATAASRLHLVPLSLTTLLSTFVLYKWAEGRGRTRWARVAAAAHHCGAGPYRDNEIVGAYMSRAPQLIRVVAASGLAFGNLFVPGLLLALTAFPPDGISVPLVPGIAIAVANWWCGHLLLLRSPGAAQAARYTASCSLIMNAGLLSLTCGHLALVEYQRLEGIEHACSSSVTAVAFVFATVSLGHALLLFLLLRVHGSALEVSDFKVSGASAITVEGTALPQDR